MAAWTTTITSTTLRFARNGRVLADRADVMVVGMNAPRDVKFGSDDQAEKAYRQFVSGNVFGVFGLRPEAGRVIVPDDDGAPGAHPFAVVSYDYWNRRFGRDPKAIGTTFLLEGSSYEIVGVAPKGFTGTEPGVVTDIFLPATMNVAALDSPGFSWFRMWVHPKAGISAEQVVQPLQAALTLEVQEHIRAMDADTPKQAIDAYRKRSILLLPAAAGASGMQKEYRRPLVILGVLVALILLIACANVGNLLTAQAAARAREMALRVSIGAGQWRLIQMMLVESALLAAMASAGGALISWWSAPTVVSMLAPAERPVRLVLDADWRVLGFGFALTAAVTVLFGLAPAIRASAVKPMSALKGGSDPRSRRGFMGSMVTVQVAFCVLVLFVAGLFVSTFERLSSRDLGFSPRGVLVLEAAASTNLAPEVWMQVADRLRQTSGVESVGFSGWTPLSGNHWTGTLRIPGHAVEPISPYLLDVSPGYWAAMRIGWIDGRDFRQGDGQPKLTGDSHPVGGVGIVNEAFAQTYFGGRNPVGSIVSVREGKETFVPVEIIGYVRDSVYSSVREDIRPTIYYPIESQGGSAFVVRTAGDPRALAPILRREMSQARPDLQVRNMEALSALVLRQMVRERLLASISFFFAIVALLLAGVGLYGVLNYSVTEQRREIGIRMTLSARPGQVVRRVTSSMLGLVCLGLSVGLAGGMACQRFVEALLFGVRATDPGAMAVPLVTLVGAAVLAALPPAIRAVKTDPAQVLHSE